MKFLGSIFHAFLFHLFLTSYVIGADANLYFGDPVKIGLLITNNKSVAAKRGAELAVTIANREGGLNGTPFAMVVRSMEGPWGTGSKQAVDLIFNEKVWALIGSHDGRNAHLVEQAATKAIVPFVSAWAGDPTLSQAFVPWFFNCVPDDYRQAETLYREIYLKRKYDRLVAIAGSDYDNNLALNNFLKKLKQEGKAEPVIIMAGEYGDRISEIQGIMEKSGAECLILFCPPLLAGRILGNIREKKSEIPVFSSHYLFNEDDIPGREAVPVEEDILITVTEWNALKYNAFAEEFRIEYGTEPGMAASYAFDAMSLLIKAVRDAGSPDRAMIQEALEKIVFNGVTGTISFDEMGSRQGPFSVAAVKRSSLMFEK